MQNLVSQLTVWITKKILYNKEGNDSPLFRLDFFNFLLYPNYVGFEVKTPLEQSQELEDQGLGVIQKGYMGGTEFETWFIYTGKTPLHLGDKILEEGDMYDLTYWSYDE